MKNIILALIAAFVVSVIAFKGAKPEAYTPIKFYDNTGEITNTYIQDLKVWLGTVQPTSSTFGIDISSAGFSQIKSVNIETVRNTADPNNIPDVSIKTMTNNMLTVNIKQANTTLVTILGSGVTLGSPMIFPGNVSDIQLIVRVTGK